ncbi:MAG: CCA tRNA nucleotidyltransferase [Gemmatimonadetes bacterium]|nr:CCA tRNA nucleotidyltransferase [Gemmatimonadota bacterium]
MSIPERVDLGAPPEVYRIARRLQSAGFDAWAVGGGVRDALAGNPPGDWDLTTSARPGDVRAIFRRTVPIGIEHGTIGVLGKDGKLYEVTTFRRDVETFGRKARVAFSDTLEEDLERRDFTINAVAWHPTTGEVRDPHGGAADLRDGVLRTVGDPEARFKEDRLRVLRALRFAGRFSLGIDPRTWAAMRASAAELGALSAERVREELYKVLALRQPSAALRLYRDSGVLASLYPELEACVGVDDPGGGGEVWSHLIEATDATARGDTPLRLAALVHDVGKGAAQPGDGFAEHAGVGAALAREMLRRLKASNADTDRVVHLVAQHADLPGERASDADFRRWLRRVGPSHYRDLFRLRIADCRARHADAQALLASYRTAHRVLSERPPLDIGDLAIGGAELRALGIPPGPRFGEILRQLLERVTEDPSLNTPERLAELAVEMKGE